MRNCTILVNSCDNYEDLWNPFFTLFKKYWPDCDCPIILNTETKEFHMEGLDIQNYHFYNGEKVEWGKRFVDYLSVVKTKYVFIILDDFFLRSPVDTTKVQQCIDWMDKDDMIANFSFNPSYDKNNMISKKYDGFELRPQKSEYKFNLQAGLWKTKDLITYVRPNESPWEWEGYGNVRSFVLKQDFYTTIDGIKPIVDYGYNFKGMGVYHGKWVVEDVDPLFKENGIQVDYDKRGRYKKAQYSKTLSAKALRSPQSIANLTVKFAKEFVEHCRNVKYRFTGKW